MELKIYPQVYYNNLRMDGIIYLKLLLTPLTFQVTIMINAISSEINSNIRVSCNMENIRILKTFYHKITSSSQQISSANSPDFNDSLCIFFSVLFCHHKQLIIFGTLSLVMSGSNFLSFSVSLTYAVTYLCLA